jgi:hypothetical protein
MLTLAMVLGVAIILAGVLVAVSPERLLSVADWESRRGLYIAAAMRVITGLVLILAAPASRSPTGFRIIGAIALLAGLVFPLLPTDRWAAFIRWWTQEGGGPRNTAPFIGPPLRWRYCLVRSLRMQLCPSAPPPNKRPKLTYRSSPPPACVNLRRRNQAAPANRSSAARVGAQPLGGSSVP